MDNWKTNTGTAVEETPVAEEQKIDSADRPLQTITTSSVEEKTLPQKIMTGLMIIFIIAAIIGVAIFAVVFLANQLAG
ncbi:MAG: hypothetical protein ABIB93_06290 [Chloroflexota bacterium]